MWKVAILILVAAVAFAGCCSDSPPPIPQVTLQAPLNGGTVSSLTPILSWESAGADLTYRVQVSTDSGFHDMAVDKANLDGLSYAVPSGKLTNDKSYYWRVSASRDGETSGWSGYWSFQTSSAPTGSIVVKATLDGSAWSGDVAYTITGPETHTGSSVTDTFSGLSTGSYTVGYSSGGPSGATLESMTPSATQTLNAGDTVTFTLTFKTPPKETIIVKGTLDGAAWTGSVNYTIYGPKDESGSSVSHTFSSMPNGTYTLSYKSGGPFGAALSSISTNPTQTLSSGVTIVYSLNFHTIARTGSIQVKATLDGAAYSGSMVNYTVWGPSSDSSSSLPYTFGNMPAGTYTIGYTSGGPVGATLASVNPSLTQTLPPGGVIVFTAHFYSTATAGTVSVMATLDGIPWAGSVRYTLHGPYIDAENSVPQQFVNLPAGTYTIGYTSGGPAGAILASISPSPMQTLPNHGTITYTLNFHSTSGTVSVMATLDGIPWAGSVRYTLNGPYTDTEHAVPRVFVNLPAGTYSIGYNSGGPAAATLVSISPSPSQKLSPGGTITFTMNFNSEPRGKIEVIALLDGIPWAGDVSYYLHGPQMEKSIEVPDTFNDLPTGTYTLVYNSGGPPDSVPVNITPSPSQVLPSGGTIMFTLNFQSELTTWP